MEAARQHVAAGGALPAAPAAADLDPEADVDANAAEAVAA